MAVRFPGNEWVKAFMEALNANERYARVAENWEDDITFVVEPDGEFRETVYLYLDLWHGRCREAMQLSDPAEKQAAFTLTATLGNYIKILKRELDPMRAMLTRRLKVQGSMVMMMRNVPTILEFVHTATTLDTEFPAI